MVDTFDKDLEIHAAVVDSAFAAAAAFGLVAENSYKLMAVHIAALSPSDADQDVNTVVLDKIKILGQQTVAVELLTSLAQIVAVECHSLLGFHLQIPNYKDKHLAAMVVQQTQKAAVNTTRI